MPKHLTPQKRVLRFYALSYARKAKTDDVRLFWHVWKQPD